MGAALARPGAITPIATGTRRICARPWAWRYRQWVIDALNRDMPFDEFTIEQLAGDLLPGATVEQRVATGFLRNTLTNREAGVDRMEARFEQIVNRTNTVSTTWLGLTVGCAQCHNHKFDPISQKDYYSMFAFFENAGGAQHRRAAARRDGAVPAGAARVSRKARGDPGRVQCAGTRSEMGSADARRV